MKLDRFINRPVLSTVISVLIVILGLIGLATLPITQYPDIAPPTVSVRATYTGANAQTVLNSVIAPLEDQINGVENMMYMTSSASNNGSAEISIYFKQGTDPDMAAGQAQKNTGKEERNTLFHGILLIIMMLIKDSLPQFRAAGKRKGILHLQCGEFSARI